MIFPKVYDFDKVVVDDLKIHRHSPPVNVCIPMKRSTMLFMGQISLHL